MNKEGILIVLSGFSGTGKGTVMQRLLEKYPEEYALSISATTRKPREGETDGVSYFFHTKEEFEEMIAKGELLEYAQYVGNYYGTPRNYVEEQLRQGKNVFLEIEMLGALKIKEKFPDTLLLFLVPPSIEILYDRLAGRGTESEEIIKDRIARAKEECKVIPEYDYLIVNDELETCVEQVHNTVRTLRSQTERNQNFIKELQTELELFLKGE
jgi:guanylate kinase